MAVEVASSSGRLVIKLRLPKACAHQSALLSGLADTRGRTALPVSCSEVVRWVMYVSRSPRRHLSVRGTSALLQVANFFQDCDSVCLLVRWLAKQLLAVGTVTRPIFARPGGPQKIAYHDQKPPTSIHQILKDLVPELAQEVLRAAPCSLLRLLYLLPPRLHALALRSRLQHVPPSFMQLARPTTPQSTRSSCVHSESLSHSAALSHSSDVALTLSSAKDVPPTAVVAAVVHLALHVSSLRTLHTLTVSHTPLGPAGAAALAPILPDLPGLLHLNLPSTALRIDGVLALSHAFSSMSQLLSLDLRNNGLTCSDEGARGAAGGRGSRRGPSRSGSPGKRVQGSRKTAGAGGPALPSGVVRAHDISSGQLPSTRATRLRNAFPKALAKLSCLQALRLAGNMILETPQGRDAISAALARLRALTLLDLYDTTHVYAMTRQSCWLSRLAALTGLRRLSLCHDIKCLTNSDDSRMLASVLSTLTSVQVLELKLPHNFRKVLAAVTHLTDLNSLTLTALDTYAREYVAQHISHLAALTSLHRLSLHSPLLGLYAPLHLYCLRDLEELSISLSSSAHLGPALATLTLLTCLRLFGDGDLLGSNTRAEDLVRHLALLKALRHFEAPGLRTSVRAMGDLGCALRAWTGLTFLEGWTPAPGDIPANPGISGRPGPPLPPEPRASALRGAAVGSWPFVVPVSSGLRVLRLCGLCNDSVHQLAPFLGRLTGLCELRLSRCALPPALFGIVMGNIADLPLRQLAITEVISGMPAAVAPQVANLTGLEELTLNPDDAQAVALASSLKALRRLRRLGLISLAGRSSVSSAGFRATLCALRCHGWLAEVHVGDHVTDAAIPDILAFIRSAPSLTRLVLRGRFGSLHELNVCQAAHGVEVLNLHTRSLPATDERDSFLDRPISGPLSTTHQGTSTACDDVALDAQGDSFLDAENPPGGPAEPPGIYSSPDSPPAEPDSHPSQHLLTFPSHWPPAHVPPRRQRTPPAERRDKSPPSRASSTDEPEPAVHPPRARVSAAHPQQRRSLSGTAGKAVFRRSRDEHGRVLEQAREHAPEVPGRAPRREPRWKVAPEVSGEVLRGAVGLRGEDPAGLAPPSVAASHETGTKQLTRDASRLALKQVADTAAEEPALAGSRVEHGLRHRTRQEGIQGPADGVAGPPQPHLPSYQVPYASLHARAATVQVPVHYSEAWRAGLDLAPGGLTWSPTTGGWAVAGDVAGTGAEHLAEGGGGGSAFSASGRTPTAPRVCAWEPEDVHTHARQPLLARGRAAWQAQDPMHALQARGSALAATPGYPAAEVLQEAAVAEHRRHGFDAGRGLSNRLRRAHDTMAWLRRDTFSGATWD